MKRALTLFVIAGVALLGIGAGVFALRHRTQAMNQPQASTTQPGMPNMPPAGGERSAVSPSTPRGAVTIDPRRQQLIGVKTVPVTREAVDHAVRAVGVVRYDETKQADINLKVEGWIHDLYVDFTGQAIQKGQPLFTLYSPDLLNTQNEYLLALKTREQLQQSTIADARQRAGELVASARQRLALWNLSAEDLRVLEEQHQVQEAIVFRSPVSGFVIEKQALKGLHVVAGQSLYKVADLSSVWIEADVYESELSGLRVGVTATVSVDAYPGDQFSGRTIYVYPYLDEKTRTNKVRFAFVNPRGRLKPGMYATVNLKGRGRMGLIVPTDAVLDSGTEQVVFVAQGDGVFEPRQVKIGRRLGETTQILEGLTEGEQVATGAAFFLDSESQLRASLQGYEATATPAGAAAPSGTQITFRTLTDPPKTGENQLEATVKDATGKPVDDAEVTVLFFMPAMPAMNMPAMRSEAKLSPAGGGVYRGNGQVMMAGKWNATVSVKRAGKEIGRKNVTVTAK